MLQLELIGLLNEYKKSSDEQTKSKIKKSISKLIQENQEKYLEFKQNQSLDEWATSLLNECENNQKEEKEKSEIKKTEHTNNDLEKIKQAFLAWEQHYTNNNKQPNKDCEKIITDLINFYILNRFETLEKILQINDTSNFEDFKNMLKNHIRIYFSNKIEKYYDSEKYKSLPFIKRIKKRRELIDTMNQIGKYKFDKQKIDEVTQ